MKREIKKEAGKQLVTQVIRGAREFSIGTVLFHRAVGQILGVKRHGYLCEV